jgi:hypothetical protein
MESPRRSSRRDPTRRRRGFEDGQGTVEAVLGPLRAVVPMVAASLATAVGGHCPFRARDRLDVAASGTAASSRTPMASAPTPGLPSRAEIGLSSMMSAAQDLLEEAKKLPPTSAKRSPRRCGRPSRPSRRRCRPSGQPRSRVASLNSSALGRVECMDARVAALQIHRLSTLAAVHLRSSGLRTGAWSRDQGFEDRGLRRLDDVRCC